MTDRPDADVVAVHREAARSGAFGRWPDHLDPRLVAALQRRDLQAPYLHQEEALRALAAGEHVVLSTSTASGKSLCFQIPIVDAVLRNPSARALLLFPTKALGRDQVESLRRLIAAVEGAPAVGAGVYDGDTPPDARRAARGRAHAVITNPDMLHRGILPHHEQWATFLAGLRVIVVDELHVYRGVFGSHVANVLRRLLRLCEHYGSRPSIVACSATIANPRGLAQEVCGGERWHLVDRDASPAGEKTFVLLNPKVVDPLTGVRRDYLKVTRAVASTVRSAGVQSLLFCRTRKSVELLTRYLRDDETAEGASPAGAAASIRGYRGGYLPDRRREVEQALRGGTAKLVATTNALELGIDVGGVDVVVLAGYPGTRAATMQRAGRAGRRGSPSLTAMVLSSSPLDQFVAADPSFIFGQPPEHARVDPDNPDVLLPHLRCAAYELPFGPAETMPGLTPDDLAAGLDYLAARGGVHRDETASGSVHRVIGTDSPAEQVDIRGPIEENFAVIDEHTGAILAEVDFEDAPLYLHPGAIYAIEGRTHEVARLEWDRRKAYVAPASVTYYTEAICKLRLRVVDPQCLPHDAPRGLPPFGTGYAHLVRKVPGFKKIRFETHENIGFGPVELPDLELHTTAAYWIVPDAVAASTEDPGERAAAAIAAAHAVLHTAAMLLMCDPSDLGQVVTSGHPSSWGAVLGAARRPTADELLIAAATPYLVLFDRTPGGAGLARGAFGLGPELFERAVRMVGGCSCAKGCPTCMGAISDDGWQADRRLVADLLASIGERLGAA